jgi:Concanavalin A-like lectin/glucanases superfamily
MHVNDILYIELSDDIFQISVDGHGDKGNTGATGPQGPQGIQGLPGDDGAPGVDGVNGTNGIDGETPNLLGVWNIGTQYNYFDAVRWTSIFEGGEGTPAGLWLAIVPTPTLGAEPGEISGEWSLIASDGWQGVEGIQGPQGIPGTGGLSIIQDDTTILPPYTSKIITHASEPLFKRIVEILIPYVTSLTHYYMDNGYNYIFDPDEIVFDSQSAHLAPSYGALGMVADYIFKDNEVKDVFNSHDAVNYNCTFTFGIVDNALHLDGVSSYMDIPNHSDFYIIDPQTHAIGIEFWIKTTTTDGDVIGLWNEVDNRRSWRIYLQGGALHFDLSSDGINTDFISTPFSSGVLNDGMWHHVGFYLDNYSGWGGRYYQVYLNGYQYGIPGFTGMGSYPLYQNTIDPIRVGALGGATASNFSLADLAELAIYKNFNLTDSYGMYGSYFQFHYSTNTMGNHLSAFSLNRANIMTAVSIDTSAWTYINNIYPFVGNYGNAVISILFSVDGKSTWKMWDGSAWQTVLATDEGTNVNSLPTDRASWNLFFVAGTLDIIIQLKTNDPTYNPEVYSVYITYGKAGYMPVDGQISFALISDTETEIFNATNQMNGEQTFTDIKTNILL